MSVLGQRVAVLRTPSPNPSCRARLRFPHSQLVRMQYRQVTTEASESKARAGRLEDDVRRLQVRRNTTSPLPPNLTPPPPK